jgi:hypothetical protein
MVESRLSTAEPLDDVVECLQDSHIANKYRDGTSSLGNRMATANA